MKLKVLFDLTVVGLELHYSKAMRLSLKTANLSLFVLFLMEINTA